MCPLAQRDFWKTAHRINGEDVVNTRLMLGATCSGDLMSMGVSAMQDLAASLVSAFVESYVDDQILVELKSKFDTAMRVLIQCWNTVRWPINAKKFATEGAPCAVTTFLGVLLDSISCTAAITPRRMASILALIDTWLSKRGRLSQKDYQSLAGTLNFVSEVIPFGRVFAKQFYDPTNWDKPLSDVISADLRWWAAAIKDYNGIACFKRVYANLYPNRHVATDAAKFGVGLVDPFAKEWAADTWSEEEQAANIAAREFAGIVMACALWGPSVAGGFLFVHSDSFASVAVLTKCAATDVLLSSLLRVAANLQLQHRFRLVVRHIAGVRNGLADQASRSAVGHPVLQHFKRLIIPQPTRLQIGTILRSKSPLLASLEGSKIIQRSEPSTSTVQQSVTASRSTLPWILWNSLRWDSPDMDAFCTSPAGCGISGILKVPP
jgi:hypothetical protein